MWKKIISAVLIFSIISIFGFADESHTPEPYDTSELPQSLKDFRRFEIITIGSLPFVMMDTTLAYTAIKKGTGQLNANGDPYKVTPFASNSTLTWDEDQKKIIGISAALCVGIGVTDLVVRLIKRSSKNKKAQRTNSRDILITPLSEDPDATLIRLPLTDDTVDEFDEVEEIIENEFEIEEVTGD